MSKFRGAGKWRAEGPARSNTGTSIRGTISQPIPFPDDDEFPIRTPGSGIALPLSADGSERPRESTINNEIGMASHQTGIAVSDYTTGMRTPPMPTQSPPPPPLPEAQVMRTIQGHRPNQPSRLRNSMTSVPDAPSIEKPQRKKSSLRSVFGKLFGKKNKGTSPSSSKRVSKASDVRAGQHRSDPSALNRAAHGTMAPQKRSASLPINEFNRALRSHSVVATDFQDFGLDNDSNTKGNSVLGERQSRPRRATTPSRLWTPNNKTPGSVDWAGLSPRPASSHARGSKAVSDEEANAAIGTAVTSSGHPNRRSRSVGELQEAMRKNVVTRRRSDEIRYWRESYDPGLMSPMSSNKAETEDPIPIELEEPRDEAPKPEPFNFGPMGEMAGMKITQAASLETRVQQLESRIHKMERDASRSRNSDALQLQDPPKRYSARNRSISATRSATQQSEISLPKHRYRDTHTRGDFHGSRQDSQKRSSSYSSSRPSTMSTNNTQLQPIDVFSGEQLLSTGADQNAARPLSTSTTIRGIPSSSPTGDGILTGEHFKALTDMIHAEQSARLNLEAVINSLQRQLQSVLMANGTTYPTPDSDIGGNQLRERKMGGGHVSNFEQYDSSDDDRYVNEEIFQTPNEDRNHFEDEIFGDGSNDVDAKSAPRTLSLSQITLGRNVQPSLNF